MVSIKLAIEVVASDCEDSNVEMSVIRDYTSIQVRKDIDEQSQGIATLMLSDISSPP